MNVSFGDELRRERELRSISLREVAEATKVNLRYLEAMERNDFEHLPGGVFNRGFVRAYAEFIGIDPEATVNAYLLEERTQKGGGDGEELQVEGAPMRGSVGATRRRAPEVREAPLLLPPPPQPAPPLCERYPLRWALWALAVTVVVVAAWLLLAAFQSRPAAGLRQPPPYTGQPR